MRVEGDSEFYLYLSPPVLLAVCSVMTSVNMAATTLTVRTADSCPPLHH